MLAAWRDSRASPVPTAGHRPLEPALACFKFQILRRPLAAQTAPILAPDLLAGCFLALFFALAGQRLLANGLDDGSYLATICLAKGL